MLDTDQAAQTARRPPQNLKSVLQLKMRKVVTECRVLRLCPSPCPELSALQRRYHQQPYHHRRQQKGGWDLKGGISKGKGTWLPFTSGLVLGEQSAVRVVVVGRAFALRIFF